MVDLCEALESPRSRAGQEAAFAYLRRTGHARYGSDPAFPDRIVRIDPDGARTVGKFVNRRFVADDEN